jgi:hypothetical protein
LVDGGIFLLLPLLIVLLMLFSFLVAAEEESVFSESAFSVRAIDNQINFNEVAKYSITITNNAKEKLTYKIYGLDLGWMIDPSPEGRIFDLPAGASKNVIVSVKPLENFKPGAYISTMYIDSYRSGGSGYQTYTEGLKLYLSPTEPAMYTPSIKITIDFNDNINPQEPLAIKLFLENRNAFDLSGSILKVQSDIPELTKEIMVDIPPLEKKTVEFTAVLNPYQQPKEYTLFFVLEKGGQTVKVIEKKITIMTLKPDFTADYSENKVFLKVFKQLAVKNNGNIRNTQEIKWPITIGQFLFTSSEGNLKTIEGQRYLVWELNLGAGEIVTINFVTNYRIPLYLLLLIILIISSYMVLRSPVRFTKKAAATKIDSGGAISELKVILEVKNISNRPLKNIIVTDFVPGIADIEKNIELGTLKPKEFRPGKEGTKVIWSFEDFDPKEHRLITYKVKSRMNILGTMSLPRAKLEFTRSNGRKSHAYSNIFHLGSRL